VKNPDLILALLFCVWEVPHLNLALEIGYLDRFEALTAVKMSMLVSWV
jgi:hypothetical protein